MKTKVLSKVFAALMAAVLTVPLLSAVVPMVSAVSDAVSPSVTSAAEERWKVNAEDVELYLPKKVRLSFEEAAACYTGGTIEPLAYYAQGVVAGCNYYLIARETAEDGTVSLKRVTVYDPNLINSSHTAKAKFTSVQDFNLADYARNYRYRLPDEPVVGGMGIPSLNTCELSEEVQAVYDTVFEYEVGSCCDPLAYLGKKTVTDGTDYALLCCVYVTTYQPDRYIDVVILHEDSDGSAYIKTSCSLFGQRTYFPNMFRNKSSIEETEIGLGDRVKVNLAAQGGSGDYRYTVSYRKMNIGKWVVKEVKAGADTFTFRPAAAMAYEVVIDVTDGSKEQSLYSIVWVNKELKNTSTCSAQVITKGQSVTVNASAVGGTGQKTYAVYYKKQSSNKWTAVQKYGTNQIITVTPKAATDYDICVKVKDGEGTIRKQYFGVWVEK